MEKWRRIKYQPNQPLYPGRDRVTAGAEHIALSRQAAGEGMVLLKNDNNVLPLARGARVALFGKGSVDYVKGGGGSGDVTVDYVKNLWDGMREKEAEGKVTLLPELYTFYKKNVETHIFNFDKELYGKKIIVEFLKKTRDEVKFDSVEELSEQIVRDCLEARRFHEENSPMEKEL